MADSDDAVINKDEIPSDSFSDMGDMTDVEEIVLGNEFDETASVIIPRATNHEYSQVNKFRRVKLIFKIYNDVYLLKSVESFRDKKAAPTRFNLTFIDPEPIRLIHFAWNWFFVALISYFLGSILTYLGGFSGLEIAHSVMLPIGLVLIAVGILSTMIFLYRTQDKFIYHSSVGKTPLISVFNQKERTDYQIFVDTLKLHINQAIERQGLTMLQRLKGELTDLRRLSEEGVITVEAYEQARGLIFKHKEYN